MVKINVSDVIPTPHEKYFLRASTFSAVATTSGNLKTFKILRWKRAACKVQLSREPCSPRGDGSSIRRSSQAADRPTSRPGKRAGGQAGGQAGQAPGAHSCLPGDGASDSATVAVAASISAILQ